MNSSVDAALRSKLVEEATNYFETEYEATIDATQCYAAKEIFEELNEYRNFKGCKFWSSKLYNKFQFIIEDNWQDHFDDAIDFSSAKAVVLYAKGDVVFDIESQRHLKLYFYKYSADENYTGNGVLSYDAIKKATLKEFIKTYIDDIYVVMCYSKDGTI